MRLQSLLPNDLCVSLLIVGLAFLMPSSSVALTSFHHHGGGYLGVDFENLTPVQRTKFGAPPKEGVGIAAVDHDAPAGKAGLRANDVIIKLNGKRAQQAEDLRDLLHKMDPGQAVILDILREGYAMKLNIVLADRNVIEQQAWSQHYRVPDPSQPASAQPPVQSGSQSFLGAVPSEIGKTFSANGGLISHIPGTLPYTGILFDVMSPQLALYFGLQNSTALLIKGIDPDSPGARAGLHAGDVICRANDAPTTSRHRWNHILKNNRHEAIKLQILRDRQTQVLLLTLAASKA